MKDIVYRIALITSPEIIVRAAQLEAGLYKPEDHPETMVNMKYRIKTSNCEDVVTDSLSLAANMAKNCGSQIFFVDNASTKDAFAFIEEAEEKTGIVLTVWPHPFNADQYLIQY